MAQHRLETTPPKEALSSWQYADVVQYAIESYHDGAREGFVTVKDDADSNILTVVTWRAVEILQPVAANRC